MQELDASFSPTEATAGLFLWSLVPELGNRSRLKLLDAVHRTPSVSLLEAWNLPKKELKICFPFLTEEQLAGQQALRFHVRLDELLPRYTQAGVGITSLLEADYPPLLREIYNPPALLFYKGNLSCLQSPQETLAVVGTRKASPYGLAYTQQMLEGLRGESITIVSGLALGIDKVAHQAALAAGLPTVGVLACGLEKVYPAQHADLGRAILSAGGCLLSEHPLGTPPVGHLFPQRNRIVVGLSQAVWMVEAQLKSGSMITASLARDENRRLLVLPYAVGMAGSEAPLHLLRQGAEAVFEPLHLKEALGLGFAPVPKATQLALPLETSPPPAPSPPAAPMPETLSPMETSVLQTLRQQGGCLSAEVLAMLLDATATDLLEALSLLELEGCVQSTPQGWRLL